MLRGLITFYMCCLFISAKYLLSVSYNTDEIEDFIQMIVQSLSILSSHFLPNKQNHYNVHNGKQLCIQLYYIFKCTAAAIRIKFLLPCLIDIIYFQYSFHS